MTRRHSDRLLFRVLILCALLCLAACTGDAGRKEPPKAVKGLLDLTHWDFRTDGPVKLAGEWGFYWGKLIDPGDAVPGTRPEGTAFIQVPGIWNGQEVEGKRIPDSGYGTYRLRVLLGSREAPMAFRFLSIGTAFDLYANGAKVSSAGVVGTTPETMAPEWRPHVAGYTPKSEQLDLLLHVSNFHHRKGGAVEAITLGTEKDIVTMREQSLALDLFLAGSIFIMGLYHLVLFLTRRKDRAPLYLGAFCLLIAVYGLLSGERYFAQIFPGTGWEFRVKLTNLTSFLSVPVFLLFIHSLFPQEFQKTFLRALGLPLLLLACVVLTTPARIYSHLIPVFHIVTLAGALYTTYVLALAFARKREGSLLLLAGTLAIVLTIVNDVLYDNSVIRTGQFIDLGIFAFIFLQTVLLSVRFSAAFKTVEHQSQELTGANLALLEEIRMRNNTEAALKVSEEQYRLLAENATDVIWTFSLESMHFTYVSPSVSRIRGYTSEEALELPLGKTMSPASLELVMKTLREELSRETEEGVDPKRSRTLELQQLSKDGAYRWVEATVAFLRNAEGRPVSLLGITRDITERRRAEEEVQRNESRLRRLVDILQHPSKTTQAFLDYAMDQAIQLTGSRIGYIYHYDEDRREFILNTWSREVMAACTLANPSTRYDLDKTGIWGEAVRQRRPIVVNDFQAAHPLKKGYPEGHAHLSRFMTVPICHGSCIVGVIGLANKETDYDETDILQTSLLMEAVWKMTEHKRTEEALRESRELFSLFLRHSPVYAFIKEVSPGESRVLHASENYVQMIGMPGSEMAGKTMTELFPPAFATKMTADDWAVVSSGKILQLDEELNGRHYTTIKYPIAQQDKKLLAGYTIDITERRRTEEAYRQLQERLQRAEKMEALGLLAGGIAHDLNNVLGIVVGYAELLLMDTDRSDAIRENLTNIMDGGQKAAAIVQDLLTLARRGVSGREVLNLNRLIAEFQQSPELERLSSYHPSVTVRTDLEPDLLNISGSSVHLTKSLYNLVSNACEAMAKGGIVTIRTANQYLDKPIQGYDEVREGDHVVLSVSDTGEGIHEANLKRIFEPFYTKKVMGRSGTGLGLAVVWGTVKDHNGYIDVQSEEGKGSLFTLYFPVTREDIAAPHTRRALSEYMGKGESIVVVDDVKGQRDLATGMLRRLNYSVSSVVSGEEAVAYFQEHRADLMVLDMIMDPGMDGLDTYARILAIHPQQKAIIVSGFSESERVKAAQALGAGAYIRKPYVIEMLGEAVRHELGRKWKREDGV